MMVSILFLLSLARAEGKSGDAAQPDLSNPTVRAETQFVVIDGMLDGGMPEEALRMLTTMREQGVHDDRLEVLQARALDAAGMKTEAISTLERLVARKRNNGEAWARLGVLYADQKRVDDSVRALAKAKRLLPKDAGVLNNYGYALYAQGHNEAAVKAYQEALALDASDVRTRNNLGFALVRLDRDAEAYEAFLGGGEPADARYNLGVACEQQNDRTGALNAYQAALQLRPDFPLAKTALARLLSQESP